MNPDFSKISASKVILWLAAIAIVSFFLGFVILAFTGGFSPGGDLSFVETGNETTVGTTRGNLEPGEARSAAVSITLGAGELTVSGGADKKYLMEYEVTNGNPEGRPVISYAAENFHGNLRISPVENKRATGFPFTMMNRWNIRLNDDIPLTLDINTGVGDSKLILGTLNLSSLRVKMGTGDQTIDFTGYSGQLQDSEITCGVGDLSIRVPKTMNSRIIVDSGVGDISADGFIREDGVYRVSGYSGDLSGTTTIHVKQGVGSVTLEAV
jgi:hypothetical protein